jgi:hypothetical protein
MGRRVGSQRHTVRVPRERLSTYERLGAIVGLAAVTRRNTNSIACISNSIIYSVRVAE